MTLSAGGCKVPWSLPRARKAPAVSSKCAFKLIALHETHAFILQASKAASLAVRQEGQVISFPSAVRVFFVRKAQGFGLSFLTEISTRKYAPLTFPPLPVTIRVDGDGVCGRLKPSTRPSRIVTPASDSANQRAFPGGFACSSNECRILTQAVLR